MVNCEHNSTKRQKFNGGNPVYLCDECNLIIGYVDEDHYRPIFYVYVEDRKDKYMFNKHSERKENND